MMLLCGQSNRIWHMLAGRHEGSVGTLLSPSYFKKVPIDNWMPFALDNGAFIAWRDKMPWSEELWRKMLKFVRMMAKPPLWAAVPDVVADRTGTLNQWSRYAQVIRDIGWPTAFCVQDGMSPADVPVDADVVFVGGTNRWKFPNLKIWTDNFPRVHCARVNRLEMFEACWKLGCESIDGTGWFRDPSRPDKLPAIQAFIEGHRNMTPAML